MMGSNCVSMKILCGVLLFCFLLMGDTAATDIFCIPLVIVDMKEDDALLVGTVAVAVAVTFGATLSDVGVVAVVEEDMVACERYRIYLPIYRVFRDTKDTPNESFQLDCFLCCSTGSMILVVCRMILGIGDLPVRSALLYGTRTGIAALPTVATKDSFTSEWYSFPPRSKIRKS